MNPSKCNAIYAYHPLKCRYKFTHCVHERPMGVNLRVGTFCCPRYAGPVLSKLIDPTLVLTCSLCKKIFTENTISMHILTCEFNVFSCVYCKDDKVVSDMKEHMNTECCKIPCSEPNCRFASNKTGMEQHLTRHDNMASLPMRIEILTASLIKNIRFIGKMTGQGVFGYLQGYRIICR